MSEIHAKCSVLPLTKAMLCAIGVAAIIRSVSDLDRPWTPTITNRSAARTRTLNDRLASDLAQNIADDVVQIEQCGTAVRYVLIDDETEQLESRRIYKEFTDAERDANELYKRRERSCLVGTLLYQR